MGLRAHVQGRGAGVDATTDEASDGGALEGEVFVDGACTGAGGSAGADAIDTEAAGGELGMGVPCHTP